MAAVCTELKEQWVYSAETQLDTRLFPPFCTFFLIWSLDFLLMSRCKNKTPVVCSGPTSLCVCVYAHCTCAPLLPAASCMH